MTENLKLLLTHITAFEEQDLKQIVSVFKPRHVKRGTFLTRDGETCREFYFIHKGCLRTYFISRQGQEKTRYVMLDCTIGTALTSFISQQPSFEFLEVLEDSQLLAISYQDFYRLNEQFPSWKLFYQKILEMAYSFQNKKIESLVTLTAKQRYEQVLRENPALIRRLSNRILASYLDVTPETLSRLKSR